MTQTKTTPQRAPSTMVTPPYRGARDGYKNLSGANTSSERPTTQAATVAGAIGRT